jgi:hypothetical protein
MKVPGQMVVTGCENNGKHQQEVSEIIPWRITRGLPCVEEGFQADVYVMAFPAPVEELLHPGINIIKILFLAGIPMFNGRNFYFCRSLI